MEMDLQNVLDRLTSIQKHCQNNGVVVKYDKPTQNAVEKNDFVMDSYDTFTITEIECKDNITIIKINCL